MSEVTVQVQNQKQTININNPSITIEIPDNSIEVDILQPDQLSIQVQNPVIEVNIGGPCDCGGGAGGHEIQDEGDALPAQPALNFIGAGVTVTDNPGNGTTDVTIPGGGGGAASIVSITYADMATALQNAALTPGQFYNITDAAGTDLGFICQAVKENEITVNGTGGYLNADFQAVGDYSNVEAGTGVAFGTQKGIWRPGFESIVIPYTNLSPDYVTYSTSSGVLDMGETYTTDLGNTGAIIEDDGAGTVTLIPDQPLVAGEVITGDISGNTATVDTYVNPAFAVGDTITGGNTGATAVITDNDGSELMAYMTSAGVAFDGSEVLDNGNGVTADMNGAAGNPDIALGDVVIWNLLHYQLTDDTLLNGTDPATNTAAYTALDKATYPETYVEAWDISEFDFLNNWLQYRSDSRGNIVFNTKKTDDDYWVSGVGACGVFQFGNDIVFGNQIRDGFVDIKNVVINDTFSSNVFEAESGIGTSAFNGGLFMQSCTMGARSYITNVENSAQFSNVTFLPTSFVDSISCQYFNFTACVLEQEASISSITGSGLNILRSTIGKTSLITSIETVGESNGIADLVMMNGARLGDSTFGGNVGVNSNTMFSAAQMTLLTLSNGTNVENNIIENGGSLTGITAGANCSISRNKIGQGATLGGTTTIGDGAKFEDNELKQNATIGNHTLGQDATVTGNRCESNSSIYGNTVGNFGSIYNNVLQSGGEITNLTLLGDPLSSATEFSENTIGINIHVSEKTIAIDVKIKGNTIGVDMTESETIEEDIIGKRAIPGFSDIPGTIDITGLTTLDITAAWAQYRGIINLTSDNATESIDTITNPPTAFPFTLRPAAGLVLTITGTAYAGIGAGQIAFKAASYTLDGDKGEYIVLEIDTLGTGCLVEKSVVNGLI